MNTKLTLRLDTTLINQAKKYASTHEKSVSQIVSDYFKTLKNYTSNSTEKLGPITQKLKGALKDSSKDESDYKKHLERKYL